MSRKDLRRSRRDSKGMRRSMRKSRGSVEIDLHMECEEEELTPCQIKAYSEAEAVYKKYVSVGMNAQEPTMLDENVVIVDEKRGKKSRNTFTREYSSALIHDQGIRKQVHRPAVKGNQMTPAVVLKPEHVFTPKYESNPIAVRYGVTSSTIGQVELFTSKKRNPSVRIPIETFQKSADIDDRCQIVSGTSGYGIKRPAAPSIKMEFPNKKASKDEKAHLVPLDEYYYGKKEGNPAYREEKSKFKFKCWYCHKMLYNNLRLMLHMQGHIDSEKQQNLDLSDITQCKHCYKQFDTPFEMQCHIEKVHQNNSNVLICRICEKDHATLTELKSHMKIHNSCEMPYICQLCNFRSSVYSDVLDHFKKRHDSAEYVLCLYCLRVFKINFSKSSGWGLTQNFYAHLQKHQMKSTKKCSNCKLTFLNKSDVAKHLRMDHNQNYKGTNDIRLDHSTTNLDKEAVMITIPTGKNNALCLNAPMVRKDIELRGLHVSQPSILRRYLCLECKQFMSSKDHFKKYTQCSLCRYATCCGNSYIQHMHAVHGRIKVQTKLIYGRKMAKEMYCMCGFRSMFGNQLAYHLVSCSKRTCYDDKPKPKCFEYDDEQEDFDVSEPYIEEPDEPSSPNKKNDQTVLGALGLMKRNEVDGAKINQTASPEPENTVHKVVQDLLNEVLDSMFPAEAETTAAINDILRKVDLQTKAREKIRNHDVEMKCMDIPSKQSDSRKKEEKKTSSRVSIFSGGSYQKTRGEKKFESGMKVQKSDATSEDCLHGNIGIDDQSDTISKPTSHPASILTNLPGDGPNGVKPHGIVVLQSDSSEHTLESDCKTTEEVTETNEYIYMEPFNENKDTMEQLEGSKEGKDHSEKLLKITSKQFNESHDEHSVNKANITIVNKTHGSETDGTQAMSDNMNTIAKNQGTSVSEELVTEVDQTRKTDNETQMSYDSELKAKNMNQESFVKEELVREVFQTQETDNQAQSSNGSKLEAINNQEPNVKKELVAEVDQKQVSGTNSCQTQISNDSQMEAMNQNQKHILNDKEESPEMKTSLPQMSNDYQMGVVKQELSKNEERVSKANPSKQDTTLMAASSSDDHKPQRSSDSKPHHKRERHEYRRHREDVPKHESSRKYGYDDRYKSHQQDDHRRHDRRSDGRRNSDHYRERSYDRRDYHYNNDRYHRDKKYSNHRHDENRRDKDKDRRDDFYRDSYRRYEGHRR